MLKALSTSATGLGAQQANIDRIANDLANANTDGYKRSNIQFEDLMYETVREAGGTLGDNSQSPVGVQTGMGVKVGSTYKLFEQGPAKMTYHPYDFMVQGNGFFPVEMPNGEVGYTRNGAFHLDAEGRMSLSNGARLIPQITIPATATSVIVTPQGEVRATTQANEVIELGQIQLVNFTNVEGLTAEGSGIFKPSQASGTPIQGVPTENGFGMIQQGALEGSNVNVANSMVDMITTQRTYEMGTRVMGVADKRLEATVNIR